MLHSTGLDFPNEITCEGYLKKEDPKVNAKSFQNLKLSLFFVQMENDDNVTILRDCISTVMGRFDCYVPPFGS